MALGVRPVGGQVIGHDIQFFFNGIDAFRQPLFEIINPLPKIDIGEPDGCFYLFKQ